MSLTSSSALNSPPRADKKPILCYVTDRSSLPHAPQDDPFHPLLEKIQAIATAGVDWIQLREKDLSGRESAALVRKAIFRVSNESHLAGTVPRILLNDRLDVALSEHAGGIHLGENSFSFQETRRLLLAHLPGPSPARDFIVGVSCHSLEAAQSAASAGADYIFFGPVFATPSKAAFGPPQGVERLAAVCNSVAIPVLAIGGITLANAPSCISAGASGIAAIRLFQDAADPLKVVRQLRA
ncbi:MAG: thiamine phosphate synthase [Candidatus Acidiferrum sp.]